MWKQVLSIFVINFTIVTSSKGPSLSISDGEIQGTWESSVHGKKYSAFQGIPYAQPPEADLRFEEAVPIEPWKGTLQANTSYICAQVDLETPVGSRKMIGTEDCLRINVYIPSEHINQSRKYDVLLQIHGGALLIGSATQLNNPMYIMDSINDMILVLFNYRLGIFGFLSTEDESIPGNNGLKDQILALKWVKKNIGYFGGNPDSITLSGHSAGGACVHLHTLSPLSRGLFHKAHIASGTAFTPAMIKEKPLESAQKLATFVGCPSEPSQSLKECLKRQPASRLLYFLERFFGYRKLPFAPFAAVLEKESENSFLSKLPYELIRDGSVADVPLIFSIVRDEGIFPAGYYCEDPETIETVWKDVAHYLLDYNYTLPLEKRSEVAQEIKDLYMGPGTKTNSKNFLEFSKIFADRYYVIATEVAAKLHSVATKSQVYFYYFNYESRAFNTSAMYCKKGDIGGIAHSADERYLFGFNMTRYLSKSDQQMKERLLQMYSSFAKTGIPSFEGFNTWTPTRGDNLSYLNMSGPFDIKMETIDHFSRFPDFWRSQGLAENERDVFSDEHCSSKKSSANKFDHHSFWMSFMIWTISTMMASLL